MTARSLENDRVTIPQHSQIHGRKAPRGNRLDPSPLRLGLLDRYTSNGLRVKQLEQSDRIALTMTTRRQKAVERAGFRTHLAQRTGVPVGKGKVAERDAPAAGRGSPSRVTFANSRLTPAGRWPAANTSRSPSRRQIRGFDMPKNFPWTRHSARRGMRQQPFRTLGATAKPRWAPKQANRSSGGRRHATRKTCARADFRVGLRGGPVDETIHAGHADLLGARKQKDAGHEDRQGRCHPAAYSL